MSRIEQQRPQAPVVLSTPLLSICLLNQCNLVLTFSLACCKVRNSAFSIIGNHSVTPLRMQLQVCPALLCVWRLVVLLDVPGHQNVPFLMLQFLVDFPKKTWLLSGVTASLQPDAKGQQDGTDFCPRPSLLMC